MLICKFFPISFHKMLFLFLFQFLKDFIYRTLRSIDLRFRNTLLSSVCVCVCVNCSVVSSSATSWTVAHQIPLFMGFWSGLLFPSSGQLPNPGIKPRSPALQAHSLPSEPPGKLILSSIMYIMLMAWSPQ